MSTTTIMTIECCGHDHDHEHEHHHHDHEDGECDDPDCSCHDHHHHHHADEVFTSWGKETPKVYTQADIDRILTALDSGDYGAILRAKGIVNGTDGTWIEFDYVPEEHDDPGGPSRLHRPPVRHRFQSEGGKAGRAVRPVSEKIHG